MSDIRLQFKQEQIELTYGKKYIKSIIRDNILATKGVVEDLKETVEVIKERLVFTDHMNHYKALRLCDWYCLHCSDFNEYLYNVLIDCLVCVQLSSGLKIQSIVGQLIHSIGLEDQLDSVKTVAELLYYLDQMDLISIDLTNKLKVYTLFQFSEDTEENINDRFFLPPSFIPFEPITKNRQQVRISKGKEDMILGKSYCQHDEDICHDILNLSNDMPLALKIDLLDQIEELPTKEFKGSKKTSIEDQEIQWELFKKRSRQVYGLMVKNHMNRFYLTHKPDSRGRLYCCGHHISYQGASFKKSIVELADKEKVLIPTKYKGIL